MRAAESIGLFTLRGRNAMDGCSSTTLGFKPLALKYSSFDRALTRLVIQALYIKTLGHMYLVEITVLNNKTVTALSIGY